MRVVGIIISAVVLIGMFASSAHAILLPEAGLTPESPFYFIDLWDENLRIFLTLNAAKRVRLRLLAAAERLAEAHEIAGNGVVAVKRALDLYEGSLTAGLVGAATTADSALLVEAVGAVNDHMPFLDEISERTPFDEKRFITLTKEESIDKQGDALRVLFPADVSSALQVYTRAVEGRFARVRKVAIDKENIREALREYEKYALLGRDIENDAQHNKGIEEQNVVRTVEGAFTGHYALLESEVLKKLRPQDEEQFRNTMRAIAVLLDIPIDEAEILPAEEKTEGDLEKPAAPSATSSLPVEAVPKEQQPATPNRQPPVQEHIIPPPPPPAF